MPPPGPGDSARSPMSQWEHPFHAHSSGCALPLARTIRGAPSLPNPLSAHHPGCAEPSQPATRAPSKVRHAPNLPAAHGPPRAKRVLKGKPLAPAPTHSVSPSLRHFVSSRATTRQTRPLKELPSAIASSACALCGLPFALFPRARSTTRQTRPQLLPLRLSVTSSLLRAPRAKRVLKGKPLAPAPTHSVSPSLRHF